MKKLTALILALMLACMMVPAVAEEDLLGTWYMTTMVMGEQSINVADLGMVAALILNEDGTASMDMNGEVTTGTWTEEEGKLVVTINDSPAEATLVDGTLIMADESQQAIFTREAPEEVTLAERNPDAAAEEFNGSWSCAYLEMEGRLVSKDILGAGGEEIPALDFEDGKFTLEGGSIAQMLSAFIPEMTSFADGAYTGEFALGEAKITFELFLLQDGMMGLSVTGMSESSISLYFVRAEAEEPAA